MPYLPIGSGLNNEPDLQEDLIPRNRPAMSSPPTRVKNRRKVYLDRHPEYFSADLELAGPLALSSYRLTALVISVG